MLKTKICKKVLQILATLVASGREATGHLHEILTGFMFYWGNLIMLWVSLKSEIYVTSPL
jgi:hypothetical protein